MRYHWLVTNARNSLFNRLTTRLAFVSLICSFSVGRVAWSEETGDVQRLNLPKQWVTIHDARASYDRCNAIWFGDMFHGVRNKDPRQPSGIYFYAFGGEHSLDLAELSQFDGLCCLAVFDGQRIDQSAWKHIAKLSELELLAVPTSHLDDASLATLLPLSKLRVLDVSMSDISDASIDNFVKFRSLEALNISGTRMTLRAAETLRSRMPECAVVLNRWVYGEHAGPTWRNELASAEKRQARDDDKDASLKPEPSIRATPQPTDADDVTERGKALVAP